MDRINHCLNVWRFMWKNAERDYLKSIASNKGGMKYETIKVKKGKKSGRN